MGMKLGPAGLAAGAILLIALASFPDSGLAAKIIVGGSDHWHFGFNYTDWANKIAPFYVNDTLVFKYDPPNSTTFPHSVYLLKGTLRFRSCKLKDAKLVGNEFQGGGQGLEFVIKNRKAHFFACGERKGLHCSSGLMRFALYPLKRTCSG